jgi:hypothetical protein
MNEILKDILSFNQVLNSVAYVFVIYFYFKINYEIKTLKEMLETDIKKIKVELDALKGELEIRDKKLNLINQKFCTEIENLKTKLNG